MLSSKNLMKNKKKKGFSLLEIVVSLGLIALFIIPMGNMVLGTVKINKAAEDKQQASVVLQETVEQISSLNAFPMEDEPSIELPEGGKISFLSRDDEQVEYLVEKPNSEYGVSVMGKIVGKAVEESLDNENGSDNNENEDGSKPEISDEDALKRVSGVLYCINNKIYYYLNNVDDRGYITVGEAINKINADNTVSGVNEISGNEIIINFQGNGANAGIAINGGSHVKVSERYSFLVIIDSFSKDININFKDNNPNTDDKHDKIEYDDIQMYVYEKSQYNGKMNFKKKDISWQPSKPIISILPNNSDSSSKPDGEGKVDVNIKPLNMMQYSVELEGIKNSKVLETMNYKFIK